LYIGALSLAGSAQSNPSWSKDNDRLTIMGWIAHLVAGIVFLVAAVTVFVRKGPFSPCQTKHATNHTRDCHWNAEECNGRRSL
jgi:hypothetical protein